MRARLFATDLFSGGHRMLRVRLKRTVVTAALVVAGLAPLPLLAQHDAPGSGNGRGRYMVQFQGLRPGAAAAVRAAGGSPVHESPELRVVAAWTARAGAPRSRAQPVELIDVDQPRYPMAQTTPYGISMVQADQVSEGSGVGSVKLCIIDSGYTSTTRTVRTAM
jgi:hypothetical protein